MQPTVQIDSRQVKEVTERLQRLNKSAYPLAVRGALNDAARDMKVNYLPKTFDKNFTIRRKTFLKAHSGFTYCKNTFNVDLMESEAGILKGRSISGDRLELQERGGTLNSRAVPFYDRNGVSPVRIGEKDEAKIKSIYYYKKFKDVKKGIVFKNKNRKLIKTDNGLYIVNKGNVWRTLYVLNSTAKIKPKRFVEPAGEMSNAKIVENFIKQAHKRFSKI